MNQYNPGSNPSSHINAHSGLYHQPSGNQNYANAGALGFQHSNKNTSGNVGSTSSFPPMSASMMSDTGSPFVGLYSNGSMCDMLEYGGAAAVWYNRMTFNSDHKDNSIQYAIYGSTIRARDLGLGKQTAHFSTNHDATGTRQINLSSLTGGLAHGFTSVNGSQIRNASYNNTLKKFLFFSNTNSNSNNFECVIYSGVDFDANPSPKAAFEAAGVTRGTPFTIGLNNWANTQNETRNNLVMILCDDGGVRVGSWQLANGLRAWRFVPTTDGSSPTITYIGATTGTTSYGSDNGTEYGFSMIQSTDRKSICLMAPYYYYHAGCMAHFHDKVNSQSNVATIQDTNSSNVQYAIPWRDDGFAFFNGGNIYNSSSGGGSITHRIVRQSSTPTGAGVSNLISMNTGHQYFHKFHTTGTTNYPNLFACTDYHSHPYNYGARSEIS